MTMQQLSLLDLPVKPYGGAVPSAPSKPSRDAAKKITPVLGTWQKRVLLALHEHGPLSDEALDRVLHCEATRTARPRRRELMMAGYIEDSTDRVLGVGQVMVTLWQITKTGEETARYLAATPVDASTGMRSGGQAGGAHRPAPHR